MEHQQAQWDTDVDEQREPEADRDALRRALRDLEAAEQRVERTAQRVYEESKHRLVLDLLPLLDNLDHTIDHAGDPQSGGALLEAIRMLRAQMVTMLAKLGVSRIDTNGLRFDPSTMEAVAMVPVRDPRYAGVVIEQLAAAYRQGDRLVRPARVTVGQLTRR